MKKNHGILYLTEFCVLGAGFSLILALNLHFSMQVFILLSILLLYCGIGLFHHSKHRDITTKVVLEYILISAILFALFIFLNISKL